MPLARILTLNPELVNDFAQQLYDLGFDIDVANPNEQPSVPADLEIEFAICDQQQVLARAAAIAAQLQAEVVVFPRAIPPLPKSIAATEIAGDPALTENNYSEPMMESPSDVPQAPGLRQQAFIRARILKERLGAQAALVLTQGSQGLRKWLEHMRKGLDGFASVCLRCAVNTEKAFLSFRRAVAGRTHSFRETLKLRIAEVRAAQERRVETRRQAAEAARLAAAERQQAVVEQVPLTAAGQEQELLRLRAENGRLMEEIERLQAESREQLAALERARLMNAPEDAARAGAAEEGRLPGKTHNEPTEQKVLGYIGVARRRATHLRGALAGAVAASFLLLAGIVLANFQARAPVSGKLNNRAEQQVPFGPTTVHGAPGVTVGGAGPAKPSPATVASRPQAPPKAQPAQSSPAPAKPSPEWHHFRNNTGSNANDVIVRHFSPPQPATQTAQQRQPVIKRYSDE